MTDQWLPARYGSSKEDCFMDDANGNRWMIRKGKFGNDIAYYLKRNGSLIKVSDTLEAAKQAVDLTMPAH